MPLQLDFVTLFPEMIGPVLETSIVGRAVRRGDVAYGTVNPRDFATDTHRTVDDRPFGGGPGMLLRAPEMMAAIRSIPSAEGRRIVFFEPSGTMFRQADALRLAKSSAITFVCGHYEGIDQRVLDLCATDVFSMGDFILTGGELPALLIADAVVRTLPNALGSAESLVADSHSDGLLSAPQYTRPEEFEGMRVPEVLLSGDHGKIARWRRQMQLRTTRERRPDLFSTAPLSRDDLDLL
ncbi:MAG: tRNA (guanosine(37)-N1)-methyltransferase TrmD [Chthonomonas sp.]|nr:tRNA (guanosine(37)-N1)-methyltransferase TrmD [Chthonomonas sp.]